MAAGTWTFTNSGRTKMINGQFDLDSDTWKVALFQSTSNLSASSTTYAGATNEVANGSGYTTGGQTVTLTLSGTTSVSVAFTANPAWTASGGNITARFAALYESGGDVLCYCLLDDTPADVVATNGNTLTIDSDGTPNPIFTLA
jgi:hypothetical protein